MAIIYFRALTNRWLCKKVDRVDGSLVEPLNVNESFWIVPGTVSVDD